MAAAGQEIHVNGGRACPCRSIARRVIDAQVVALAGHDHVVVTVQPALGRAARTWRGQRRQARPLGRLAFLAAEGTAHAAAFAGHLRIGNSSMRATRCCTSVGCWVET